MRLLVEGPGFLLSQSIMRVLLAEASSIDKHGRMQRNCRSVTGDFQVDCRSSQSRKASFSANSTDEDTKALQRYQRMRDAGMAPSISMFLEALKACGSRKELLTGRKIHSDVIENRHQGNIFVVNTLVDMYARCGSLAEARGIFDRIEHPTLVSWNAIIKGYAQCGQGEIALQLFARMQDSGFEPDARTYVAALNACSSLAAKEDGQRVEGKVVKVACLEKGVTIHSQIVRRGEESNRFLASSLLDMYVKCGSVEDAQRVFDRVRHCSSVVSWNVVILGFAESDKEEQALSLFMRMQQESVTPDARTFVAALIACSSLAAKEIGKQVEGKVVKVVTLEKGLAIHSEVAKRGYDSNVFVGSSLVDMYARCRSMEDAGRVLDGIPERDVVLWTAVILGYVESEEAELALEIFVRMLNGGTKADERSYVAALRACSVLAAKEEDEEMVKNRWLHTGLALHALVVEDGHEGNVFVANTLVDLYAKCRSIEDARRVFDQMPLHTVVSWTAMIWGYVESDENELALQFFEFMQVEGSLTPDAKAFVPALMACTSLASRERGIQIENRIVKLLSLEKSLAIHSRAVKLGHEMNVFLASTLVDLYAKCGSLFDAERVFNRMLQRSSVSWNAMMMAYAEGGREEMALELFASMQEEGFRPDDRTFIAALSACGSLAVSGKFEKLQCLEKGMKLHCEAADLGFDRDIFVANTLVDMYSKCGCLDQARRVFERIKQRTVVSWNAIISGYADNGENHAALEIYSRMQQENVTATALTYIPALKACGSLVFLEAGKQIHSRVCDAGLLESCDQLVISLISFYGKCGSMDDARQVFESFGRSSESSIAAWNSLLGGYSQCGDTKQMFEMFERMKKECLRPDGVTFVLLLSACSHAGMVDEGKECFELMSSGYGLVPGIEHFNCLVDMLGRANFVEEAVAVMRRMPCESDLKIWKTLLSSCIKWKSLEVGRFAFDRIQAMDELDSAAYVLMANLTKLLR